MQDELAGRHRAKASPGGRIVSHRAARAGTRARRSLIMGRNSVFGAGLAVPLVSEGSPMDRGWPGSGFCRGIHRRWTQLRRGEYDSETLRSVPSWGLSVL